MVDFTAAVMSTLPGCAHIPAPGQDSILSRHLPCCRRGRGHRRTAIPVCASLSRCRRVHPHRQDGAMTCPEGRKTVPGPCRPATGSRARGAKGILSTHHTHKRISV